MMNIFYSLVILILLSFHSVHAADSGNWNYIRQDGFSVGFESAEAETAAKAVPVIISRFKTLKLDNLYGELDAVKARRNEILFFIAFELGMAKPGTHMSSVYDKFGLLFPTLIYSLNKAREFRLWNREKLRSFLATGGKVPGFSYVKDTDEIFFNIHVTDPNVHPFTGPLPLVVDKSRGDMMKQIYSQLDTYESTIKNIPGAGVIFHEVAEIGMSADIGMENPFRRWLCEGAANYIALKALEKFIGNKAALEYAADFDTESYKDVKKNVDLIAWRAIEWDKITPPWSSDLTQAYYNYATKAFVDHIAKTSPEKVPEFFRMMAAGKGKSDTFMYVALQKVTGKDVRKELEGEYPQAKSPFRGFAVKLLDIRTMSKKAERSGESIAMTDNIPFTRNRSSGLKLIITYAMLDQPVELKVEFMGNGMKAPDRFIQTLSKPQDTIAVDMIFGEVDLKPGPALFTVYINGAVLQKKNLHLKAE